MFTVGTLTARTPVLGLRLSTVIAIAIAAMAASVTAAVFFLLRHRRRRRLAMRVKHASGAIKPARTKEIPTVFTAPEKAAEGNLAAMITAEVKLERVVEVIGGDGIAGCSSSSSPLARMGIMAGNMGWGRWYSMRELEEATGGFDEKNVIGEGGYGIVYRGILPDCSVVAVKNLLDKKGQAEKEFKVEVETMGKVRHKNLVGLIGYCAEGPKRMLVYEFVENGNLEQWLHGDVGPVSPLTWDVRMKIAVGTAKGIAYLHEGLEPKIVHRDIKSSNILLDRQFNPKVSDFGLAKLLGPGSSYVTTRVMGTFGYVAPEYACTGMLNEGSDIYSFGVLLMELISGRPPVDYGRPVGEVNLVDWFKVMVGSKCGEEVLDPRIDYRPPPRALKRVLLVCLRCIDSDAHKRPKMGQIAHMLEGDEFPFRMEHRSPREVSITTTAGPAATGRIPLPPMNMQIADTKQTEWR